MKKTSIILALSMSMCLLTACGSITISSELPSSESSSSKSSLGESSSSKSSSGESSSDESSSDESFSNKSSSGESSSSESKPSESSQNSAGSTRTDTIYTVFSGNRVNEHTIEYTGEKKNAKELADELTKLTGLDFTITASETSDGLIIDWDADSSLFTGPKGEQKKDFFFFDYDTMCWFMMNTICKTMTENFDVENIYYTMDGGKELSLKLSPRMTFPSDIPYMGSDFYLAHTDLKGDDDEIYYENTQADYQGFWQYPDGTILEVAGETWNLYYADGTLMSSEGLVGYEDDCIVLRNEYGSSGGGIVYFDDNGQLKEGDSVLTYIGDENIYENALAAEIYLGQWCCDRATLNISDNGDGTYQGKITWADSAYANAEWVYILTFDSDSQSMVCNNNAVKTYYEYKDGFSEPETTVMYTGGSGSFYLANGVITWYDAEENRGEGMEFVK